MKPYSIARSSETARAMPITFRPIEQADLPFLLELYSSTRRDELAAVPWNEEQRRAFLQMQFAAQHHDYTQRYPGGDFMVILSDGRPVGRIYIARQAHEIRIMDITIEHAERNAGTGTSIIKDLMAEAAETGRPLTIYVESFNPSLRLFERLGFTVAEEGGIHLLMRWSGNGGGDSV